MKKNPITYACAFLMVIFYMTLAGILIFSPIFDTTFSLTLRIVAGVIFFLYAIFRAYRILKK